MVEYPPRVSEYLARLYADRRRRHACRAQTQEEFARWRKVARNEFRRLLRLPLIAEESKGHSAKARVLCDREDMGAYFRQRGWIETEPEVRIWFWMLTPKRTGPFPLAITPHGHENADTYIGIWHDERSREQIANQDQDVAVQAVGKGFLTIAPSTRGIGANPSSLKFPIYPPGTAAVTASVTAGKSLWLDEPCWARTRLEFREYWDVAGLVAPHRLLTVNGDRDPLHPVEEVDHAVSRLRKIYRVAGAEDCYTHRFGHGGHRFYSDLM